MMTIKEALAEEHQGNWPEARRIYEGLLKGDLEPHERAEVFIRLGNCLNEDGPPDAAEDALAEGARLAEDIGDDSLLGQARLLQGLAELDQGHHKRALARLTRARELLGDQPKVSRALATAMRERGELSDALTLLQEIREAENEPEEQAEILDELGAVYIERGEFAEAEAVLREALELDSRIGTDYQTARSRLLLAQAVMSQGRRRESRRLIEEAAECYDDVERGLAEVYLTLGEWYEDSDDYIAAAKQYRRARDIEQESDRPVGQARASRKLARMHRLRGDKDRAQDALEDAERLLAGLDDDIELAALFTEEGYFYIADVDYDRAAGRFERALAVAKGDADERAIAIAKRGLAQACLHNGDLAEAEALLRDAVPVLRERGDLRELDEVYDDLAAVLIEKGEYSEALEFLELSAAIDEQLNAVSSKARTLLLMGKAHLHRGDRREAGSRIQAALDVYHDAEDLEGKANALLEFGAYLAEEGRLNEALDRFKEALRLDTNQEDSVGIARAHRSIANVYRQRGEYERAEDSLHSASSELKISDDPMEDALLSVEWARLESDRAEWREAESHLREALRSFDESRYPIQRAVCERLLAKIYAVDPKSRPKALELLESAGAVLRESHDYPELDDLYDDKAELLLSMRRYEDAMEAVQQSLDIGRDMDWERGNGRSFQIMGRINMKLDRMKDAKRDFLEAIECYERAGDDVGRSEATLTLGDWYVANNLLPDAVRTYKEARRLDRWHGDLRGMSQALRKLGEVYFRLGEPMRAEEAFDQAEEYLNAGNFVEDRGHLALARGCLFRTRGEHERAVQQFKSALDDFDSLLLDEERSLTYKEMAMCYHALGQYEQAMECMRKMGLEQAALWGSLLDHFSSEIRNSAQQAYLRGDYGHAIAGAYGAVEKALRERTLGVEGLGNRPTVSALIDAWYQTGARGLGDLDEKSLANLRRFASAAFDLFRNSVMHSSRSTGMDGVEGFVALAVANHLVETLDSDK